MHFESLTPFCLQANLIDNQSIQNLSIQDHFFMKGVGTFAHYLLFALLRQHHPEDL